jgi:hypothetical protein
MRWYWPWPSYRTWRRRRRKLSTLAYLEKVADAKARIAMAPSRAKMAIELDLRWANPLDKTWRDEIIVILWSLPLLGMLLPFSREYVFQWFEQLKTLDPSAPSFFMWGWAIIFGATFGAKHLKQAFMPSKLAGLLGAMTTSKSVSDTELETAQDAVSPSPSNQP